MKILRRNAIIITVILFICVAVYLNWAYNRQERKLDQTGTGLAESAASLSGQTQAEGLFYEAPVQPAAPGLSTEVADYFTSARLNRQQARDSAIATLREAAETVSATQDAVDEALGAITAMAAYTVSEAELEAMVMAKGFEDCLVFLNEDSVIVAVPSPQDGLGAAAISRITDLVLEESGLTTEQVKIIGVK